MWALDIPHYTHKNYKILEFVQVSGKTWPDSYSDTITR